jgi:hypothetical protein
VPLPSLQNVKKLREDPLFSLAAVVSQRLDVLFIIIQDKEGLFQKECEKTSQKTAILAD